mgnify:CR=1 FL=1
MKESFRGEYYQKVDAKARMLIPVPFRRLLDRGDEKTPETPRTRIVIVYGGGRARQYCEVYPMDVSEVLATKIRRMQPGSEKRKSLELEFFKRSATVEIDDDGRIVVPPQVREKLGITGDDMKSGAEVVLAGIGSRLGLWGAGLYRGSHAPPPPGGGGRGLSQALGGLPLDDDLEF